MERQYNLRSPAVKRLMREAQELREPTEIFYAQPLEDNLFEWHFTIRGPLDTDFDGGVYHGRIILPPEYPMKPPSIILLTPNGRFELFKKICLSISGHHPESWQPSWSIRTALLAIIGFMPTHGSGAIGALDYTPEERKMLAKKSREWKCSECGAVIDILKPLTEASKSDSQEAKELASQINFQAEKQNGSTTSEASTPTPSTEEASAASDARTDESSSSASVSASAPTGSASAAPSTAPMAPATNFPFPPPFNPAMYGARMPMMPGFMPPMMPQFATMPGMNAAASMGQTSIPQIPHPLISAQMTRMNPFWPMMNHPMFQGHPAQGGQRSFQQMMEMMQSMQQGNPMSQPLSHPMSQPVVSQPVVSVSERQSALPATSATASTASTVTTAVVSATSTSPVSSSSTSPAPSVPTSSTSADPSTPVTPTVNSSSPPARETQSASPTENDSEVRQRRPPAPPTPAGVGSPTASRPVPLNANTVHQTYSAELPTTRTRTDNPAIVFLILVLGLAIVALIVRRVYQFNLWNYDY